VEEDLEQYKAFLDRHLFGTSGFHDYLHLCGGLEMIRQLRAQEHLLHLGL
jgi:hypothetical protein